MERLTAFRSLANQRPSVHLDWVITGHLGAALAARSYRKEVPLALLTAAALAPDLLDAVLYFAPLCNPFGLYSHGLVAMSALCVLFAVIGLALRLPVAAVLILVALVVSHLAFDLMTGEKLLLAHGPIAGLRIYRSPALDFLMEVPIVFAGWLLLRRRQSPPTPVGSRAAIVALITLQLAMNITMVVRGNRELTACEVQARSEVTTGG
jgi:hypothetical protein